MSSRFGSYRKIMNKKTLNPTDAYPYRRPFRKVKAPMGPRKSFVPRGLPLPRRGRTFKRKGDWDHVSGGGKGLKRPLNTKFNRKVQDVVMNKLSSENAYLENYIDVITTAVEAKDATGNQIMWAVNQTAASGGLAAGTRYNLLMHDPTVLSLISQNISALATTKATIKSYSVMAKLVNAGTAPLVCWEYRCKARNNLAGSTLLQTLLVDGFSNAGTGVGTKPAATTLGATPFNSPSWCSQFKIVKVKKWELGAAQTKWIKYKNNKDYTFCQEYISPDGNANGILRGRCMSVFVMQGSFGYLSSNTAGKKYGIVAPNLGIEYYTKVHYSWINDENVSLGSNVYITGLTQGGVGGGSHVPCPIVINHPDSAIGTLTVANSTRAYGTGDDFDIEDQPFNIN